MEQFISNMEQAAQGNPMLRRWVYGVKEKRRLMLVQVVALAKYPELIPNNMRAEYAIFRAACLKELNDRP